MRGLALVILLPLSLAAAIVTEENDLYTVVPHAYTFYGSLTDPGIDSQWIPYGTYTAAEGTNEYRRVTSNLVGVVYSAHDGYWERYWIPQGVRPIDMEDDVRYYPTTVTNETRRIIDLINPTSYIKRSNMYEEDYEFETVAGGNVEYRLARSGGTQHAGLAAGYGSRLLDEFTGHERPPLPYQWTVGIPYDQYATNEWRNVFPVYSALEADDHFWDDERYVREEMTKWLYPSHLWGLWDTGYGNGDIYLVYDALQARLLDTPITNQIEHVLARDPGWTWPVRTTNDYWLVTGPVIGTVMCERINGTWDSDEDARMWAMDVLVSNRFIAASVQYTGDSTWFFSAYAEESGTELVDARATVSADGSLASATFGDCTATKVSLFDGENVFEHWRNDTRRLDWTRLGIICQLERQMEITQQAREAEDYAIMMTNVVMTRTVKYESQDVMLTFCTSNTPTGFNTPVLMTDLSNLAYYETTNIIETTRYSTQRCYPTARGAVGGRGSIDGGIACPLYVGVNDIWYVAEACSGYFPDATSFEIVFDVLSEVVGDEPNCEIRLYGDNIMVIYDGLTNEFPQVYQPALCTIGPEVTWEDTAKVRKRIDKSSEMHYTAFDDSVVTNLVWETGVWPTTNQWTDLWPVEVKIPNLESMIVLSNDYSVIRDDPEPMLYNPSYHDTNDFERSFRYDPLSERVLQSHSAVEDQRVESLRSLNSAVADKFESLTGNAPPVFPLRGIGDVSDVDELLTAETNITTDVQLAAPDQLKIVAESVDGVAYVRALYMSDDGENWVELQTEYVPDDDETCWAFAFVDLGLTSAVFATNTIYRVDGHQDQMPQTLWRFRNLRDPDL